MTLGLACSWQGGGCVLWTRAGQECMTGSSRSQAWPATPLPCLCTRGPSAGVCGAELQPGSTHQAKNPGAVCTSSEEGALSVICTKSPDSVEGSWTPRGHHGCCTDFPRRAQPLLRLPTTQHCTKYLCPRGWGHALARPGPQRRFLSHTLVLFLSLSSRAFRESVPSHRPQPPACPPGTFRPWSLTQVLKERDGLR